MVREIPLYGGDLEAAEAIPAVMSYGAPNVAPIRALTRHKNIVIKLPPTSPGVFRPSDHRHAKMRPTQGSGNKKDLAFVSVKASQPRASMMRALPLPIALTTLLLMVVPVASSEQSAAVFDFELIDTSLEGEMNGPRADEQARVGRLGEELRKRLAASGRFVVVDIGPVAREAHASNLQACGGCDVQFAKRLGAALAITGTVQKVSNLILNMNVYIRSADTGRLVAAASVDMRGNTDESWMRGLDWLIRNRLLAVDDGTRK